MPSESFPYEKALSVVNALAFDYKASVVAGELADNGVPFDAILFKNLGIFRRFVSKEIETIRYESEDNEAGQLLFELNREGLYDMLPEVVFHAGRKKEHESDSDLFKAQKAEEVEARKFFSPIENEFARRLLYFDVIERDMCMAGNTEKNREFFEYFFGDSSMLNDMQVLVLCYILPLSYKICSETTVIASTLTRILGYKTSLTKQFRKERKQGDQIQAGSLGQSVIGVDCILSDGCDMSGFVYRICVEGIPPANFPEFSEGGIHRNVIDFILPYFFAANADVVLELVPEEDSKYLQTSDEHHISFLEFNSYI